MEEFIIHNSNLVSALNTAIETQRKFEKNELNYTRDSALVAGWNELRKSLLENDKLIIVAK